MFLLFICFVVCFVVALGVLALGTLVGFLPSFSCHCLTMLVHLAFLDFLS